MISDDLNEATVMTGTAGSAPMTRALSVLLIVGQWLLAAMFVLLLVMALIMAVPTEFRDSFLAESTRAPKASILMGQCLAGAALTAGWFFVIKLLRKVVAAVMHGDPFLPANVARLRNIWIIMTIAELFRMVAYFVIGSDPDMDGSRLDVRVGTWFFIFIIAAISEAFRHGAALRADQELTI